MARDGLWKIEPFMKWATVVYCVYTYIHFSVLWKTISRLTDCLSRCYAKIAKAHSKSYKQIFCWGMKIENSMRFRAKCRLLCAFFSCPLSLSFWSLSTWLVSADGNEEKAAKSQKSIATVVVIQCEKKRQRERERKRHAEEKETLIAFIACLHFNSKNRGEY